MKLSSAPRWGGRRKDAGRTRNPASGLPDAARDRFASMLPAHVTLRLAPDLVSLRTKTVVRAVERTFAAGAERSSFRLVHYSLQGNHAHLIVEARDHEALGRGMMAIGTRLALAVNRVMGRQRGRVVADRYHTRLLRSPREVHRALRYVLLNARRHLANAATRIPAGNLRLDPASSARWFDGWKRGLSADVLRPPSGLSIRPVVARARTWLLKTGWRIHGLLDPGEVPGSQH